MMLQAGGINEGTQGADCADLLADHFSHVGLGDPDLDARRALALDLADINRLGIINEGLHHYFNRFAR
jgi:hypothetical protein